MPKRILIVGHCGVDGPRLQREIASQLKSADAPRINSMEDLREACDKGADLLLVNREPLGFEPLTGVDLIRTLHQEHPDQKAMLISDYPEAQQEAAQVGAVPGFGKSDIGTPAFSQAIRGALGA